MQHPMLQDGAYATWQKMLALKVVPNVVTQRVLALAFGGNPQMASALVAEAQKLQARSLGPSCHTCVALHSTGSTLQPLLGVVAAKVC